MGNQLAHPIRNNKKTLNKGKSIKNANMYEFSSLLEELNKWTIPKVQPKEI